MKQLPDTLSALIRLAVKDMDLVKADPNYELDMNFWHTPDLTKCHVCMAGSVIAKTLNCFSEQSLFPSRFADAGIRKKLWSLNSVRLGELMDAWYRFYSAEYTRYDDGFKYICGPNEGTFRVPSYETDYEKFKNTMLKFADMIEKEEIRKGVVAHGNI